VLAASLPHVDAWNTWYTWYGNTAEGFAKRNAEIDQACARGGREARTVRRSACVLVSVGAGGERPNDVAPVPAEHIGAHLKALAAAGLDEAILVVDPITEHSVRGLAQQLGLASRPTT
jgi:alkanesulfonate monooxygenase SsuD/methylene tetrahydromethanopterin reductase-like flavin-dependent oxidoreductase (luciferase family)